MAEYKRGCFCFCTVGPHLSPNPNFNGFCIALLSFRTTHSNLSRASNSSAPQHASGPLCSGVSKIQNLKFLDGQSTGSISLRFLRLGTCHTLSTHAGPLLIISFVDFTPEKVILSYEGYVLVLILITTKAVVTTSTHMYQITCNKLGKQVRSVLISTVYWKSLRYRARPDRAMAWAQS